MNIKKAIIYNVYTAMRHIQTSARFTANVQTYSIATQAESTWPAADYFSCLVVKGISNAVGPSHALKTFFFLKSANAAKWMSLKKGADMKD